MLIQILTHTPIYVWAILALLVYRGVVAMRDRAIAPQKMLIIPLIMLALSLQDVVAKFGVALFPLGAWAGGAAVMTLLVYVCGRPGIDAGPAPGMVRVHGSPVPLAMMMAIFFIKYALAVTLVAQPHASRNALFSITVCVSLGVFSGYFVGRLARDLKSCRELRTRTGASGYLTLAA